MQVRLDTNTSMGKKILFRFKYDAYPMHIPKISFLTLQPSKSAVADSVFQTRQRPGCPWYIPKINQDHLLTVQGLSVARCLSNMAIDFLFGRKRSFIPGRHFRLADAI